MTPRRVSVLGSTGSVGCTTVALLSERPDDFNVEALAAGSNIDLLVEQARILRPRFVAAADTRSYARLTAALEGSGIEIGVGPEAVVEAAQRPADWVMAGIVGAAGLAPTLAAIERGATVALANKECLVCAGELLLDAVQRSGATLLPVDSEHSAIFQVFDFARPESVARIILTASGGPFRCRSTDDMRRVTTSQALAHPNWAMGSKISIDSATMMNKGLELIEAHHLFRIPADRIEILVHPQSVVHSMVAYRDGSMLAQLGVPDMRTPIAVALAWPDRLALPNAQLDLVAVGSLTFEAPDPERFPALRLAREALRRGGSAPAVLNAANEVAVRAFLDGEIGFLGIAELVEETLARIPAAPLADIEAVLAIDEHTRKVAEGLIGRFVVAQRSKAV